MIEWLFFLEDLPLLIAESRSTLGISLEHVDQSLLGLVWRLEGSETHVGGQVVSPQCSVTFKIKATFFPCGAVSLKIGKVLDRERKKGKVLPTEPRDLDFFGLSFSSMASSLINSLKKYWLQFLESWYITNQSATWHLERTYSRHFVTSSSYLWRTCGLNERNVSFKLIILPSWTVGRTGACQRREWRHDRRCGECWRQSWRRTRTTWPGTSSRW